MFPRSLGAEVYRSVAESCLRIGERLLPTDDSHDPVEATSGPSFEAPHARDLVIPELVRLCEMLCWLPDINVWWVTDRSDALRLFAHGAQVGIVSGFPNDDLGQSRASEIGGWRRHLSGARGNLR